jgi:hypothetical protein
VAREVTLAQIVSRAQRLTSLAAGSGAGQITATEWDELANEAVVETYEMLAHTWPERYQLDAIVPTVPNQGFLPLPQDFWELIAVYYIPGPNQRPREMLPYQEREYTELWSRQGWSTLITPRYQITGTSILLMPTPRAIHNVLGRYIPVCPELNHALPITLFDGVHGWEAYAVARTARLAAVQDETIDLTAIDAEISHARDRIITFGKQLNRTQPRRILATRHASRAWRRT